MVNNPSSIITRDYLTLIPSIYTKPLLGIAGALFFGNNKRTSLTKCPFLLSDTLVAPQGIEPSS